MGIKNIEDQLIAQAKAALTYGGGLKVRGVASGPGQWDEGMIKRRLLAMVPCVIVVFMGGPALNAGEITAKVQAHWRFIVATGQATEAARRAGGGAEIGAYEIIEHLIPALDGWTVPGEGTLSLQELENLYSSEVESQGLTIYGLTFTHEIAWPGDVDLSTLSDFATFQAMYDTEPLAGELEYQSWLAGDFSQDQPAAQDSVALPSS